MSSPAQWANNHDVAHLQAKTVPMNLILSESTQWSLEFHKVLLECLLCPWAHPCGPNGHMTMVLYIYRPRWFQWTKIQVSLPSSCWVPASARFQECLLHPWAHPCGPDGLMTTTLHIYRPRWFNELRLERICPVVVEFRWPQSSESAYYACGHVHMAPIGIWQWHCTSTGQDSSNELDFIAMGVNLPSGC